MVAIQDPPATQACPRCKRGRETYVYMNERFEFDVDRAREIVQDGREALEIEEESVRESVEASEIHEMHIAHVDPSIPGIIAHLFYRTPEGETIRAHLLIDGNHRAARCLQDQRPFEAYLLTEEESEAVLLRSPDKPGPLRPADPVRAKEETAFADLHEPTTAAYEKKYALSKTFSLRARKVIAGATTHDRRGFGPFGVYIDRAQGARKWDVAGNPFIDYWMGHGALLQGHGFGPIVEAITSQAQKGTHFGACHPLEVRWTELVRDMIPSAERVRFTASGTEATLLALRVARAYTGRNLILKFDGHFHGWHDEAMAHFYAEEQAGFNPGTVGEVALASPEDWDGTLNWLESNNVAAVILEPGGGAAGGLPWGADYLQRLREATRDHGTLLIFDEVVTGFRHSPGGVQQEVNVLPDITTLAKILCGGLPGGAVGGRADVMAVFGEGTRRGDRWAQIPHTGTFNANPLSAAAGIAMLESVRDGRPQQRAKRAAEALAAGVNACADKHGVDVHFYTNGTSIYHILIGAHQSGAPLGPSVAVTHLHRQHPEKYALLRRALLVAGVDTHPVHGWVSAVHDDAVIEETVAAFDAAFRQLSQVPAMRRGS